MNALGRRLWRAADHLHAGMFHSHGAAMYRAAERGSNVISRFYPGWVASGLQKERVTTCCWFDMIQMFVIIRACFLRLVVAEEHRLRAASR